MERQRPDSNDHAPEPPDQPEPAARQKRKPPVCVQLKGDDRLAVQAVVDMFPPGTLTVGRVARLAMKEGLPAVEAKLREAAGRYAEKWGEPPPTGKEPR